MNEERINTCKTSIRSTLYACASETLKKEIENELNASGVYDEVGIAELLRINGNGNS